MLTEAGSAGGRADRPRGVSAANCVAAGPQATRDSLLKHPDLASEPAQCGLDCLSGRTTNVRLPLRPAFAEGWLAQDAPRTDGFQGRGNRRARRGSCLL